MKGYVKNFSNLHDSNCERVAFSIFCVLFFKNIAGFHMTSLKFELQNY